MSWGGGHGFGTVTQAALIVTECEAQAADCTAELAALIELVAKSEATVSKSGILKWQLMNHSKDRNPPSGVACSLLSLTDSHKKNLRKKTNEKISKLDSFLFSKTFPIKYDIKN